MFDEAHRIALTPILAQFSDRLIATGLPRDELLTTREQITEQTITTMNLREEPDLYPYGFRLNLHIHHGVLALGVHPALKGKRRDSASRMEELTLHACGERPGDAWLSADFSDPERLPAHPCEQPDWITHLSRDGDFPEYPGVQTLHRVFLHVTDLLSSHQKNLPKPGQRFVSRWGRWTTEQDRRHPGFLWAPGEDAPHQRVVTEAQTSDSLRVKVTGDDLWHEIALLDSDVHISRSEIVGRSYDQACDLFHQRDVAAIQRSV